MYIFMILLTFRSCSVPLSILRNYSSRGNTSAKQHLKWVRAKTQTHYPFKWRKLRCTIYVLIGNIIIWGYHKCYGLRMSLVEEKYTLSSFFAEYWASNQVKRGKKKRIIHFHVLIIMRLMLHNELCKWI